LEDGGKKYILLPKIVNGFENIIEIETGAFFISALKNDGTVWVLGANSMGELGDSTILGQSNSVKVPVLENIKEISSSYNYTLALKNDGTIWGFGKDELLKIETPTSENLSAPRMIEGCQDIKKADAGDYYALALGNGGTLWCWSYTGLGFYAGGTVPRQIPQKVVGINEIMDICNGAVLKKDGTVWVINNKLQPKKVNNLNGIKSIYKNDYNSIFAIDRNNTIWCVDMTTIYNNTAKDLNSITKKAEIQLNFGLIKNIKNRLALQNDGTVLAWGNNEYGQAGNGECSFFDIPIKLK
jgi:alpha-tubulin suppressor-like RCC1 family protein